MTTANPGHRERPCARCPWRRDVDVNGFSDADMRKLAQADGAPGAEAGLDAPQMACHLDQPETAYPLRLCAGWLAVVGRHHLPTRLAVLAGRLPAHALDPGPGWPALWCSLREMLALRRPGSPPAAHPAPHGAPHRERQHTSTRHRTDIDGM